MPVSSMPLHERIARALAGQHLSANADGDLASASESVDAEWRDHAADALAVLRTLREPDEKMAAFGDPGIWEAMARAAIDEAEASR